VTIRKYTGVRFATKNNRRLRYGARPDRFRYFIQPGLVRTAEFLTLDRFVRAQIRLVFLFSVLVKSYRTITLNLIGKTPLK